MDFLDHFNIILAALFALVSYVPYRIYTQDIPRDYLPIQQISLGVMIVCWFVAASLVLMKYCRNHTTKIGA